MKCTQRKWLGRTARAAIFAFAGVLFAPGVLADEANEDAPTLTPVYPNERPSWAKPSEPPAEPTNQAPKQPGWYGGQVIATTVAFDIISVIGVPLFVVAHNELGGGFIIAGMIGRSLSGPIVHGVHGQTFAHGMKSYGLEVSGVLVGVGMAALMGSQCPSLLGADHLPPQPSICHFRVAASLLTAVPLAVSITGTVLDSIFLAHDKPNAEKKTSLSGFTLSPYVIPAFQRDERTGKQNFGMHFGFGGTF